MRKIAENFEDVDDLIYQLTGTRPADKEQLKEQGNYQWPVKVSGSGALLEDNQSPTSIGDFIPNKYLNDSHKNGHWGSDIQAPKGTPLYSIGPGIVLDTDDNPKGGHTVKISHEDGKLISYYAHLDKVNVAPKQEINFTTVIGFVGNSGNARYTSSHCHLEIKLNNNHVDPKSIIGKPVGSFSKSALTKLVNYFYKKSFK